MGRVRSCLCTLALLACLTPPAHGRVESARWLRIDSAHFTILTDLDSKDAVECGNGMERLFEALGRTMEGPAPPAGLATRVYVFRSREEYRFYTPFPGTGETEWAGCYLNSWDGHFVVVDASAGSDYLRTTRHEAIHLYCNELDLPPWLGDGIAEVYSTFKGASRTAVIGDPIQDHVAWLRATPFLPLSRLFEMNSDSLRKASPELVETYYAESWLLAHKLLVEWHDREEPWRDFQQRRNRGESSGAALEHAYGLDLDDLLGQLKMLVASGNFFTLTWDFETNLTAGVSEIRDLRDAELLCDLGDLLVHRRPSAEEAAREHYRDAVRADSSYAPAYAGLGLLELLRDRPGDAEPLLRRAVEKDRSLLYTRRLHAEALWTLLGDERQLSRDSDSTPSHRLEEVRQACRDILVLAPGDEEARFRLGMTYAIAPGDAPSEGIDALMTAYQANPRNVGLLRPLLFLQARIGNRAGARNLLEKGLRGRADAKTVAEAESWVLQSEIDAAEQLLREKRIDEALRIVEAGVAQTKADDVRKEGEDWLDGVRDAVGTTTAAGPAAAAPPTAAKTPAGESFKELVERYNAAVRDARTGGNLERALEAIERVRQSPRSGDDLREAAAVAATEVRGHIRYRDALALVKGGQPREAIPILADLLDSDLKPEFRTQVSELLTQARLVVAARK